MVVGWGGDEGRLRDIWPTEALPADRLPGVVAARADGWSLAPDAPMWSYLPAVWPPAARAWIPDRSVPLVLVRCGSGNESAIPWSGWDHAEHEHAINASLVAAGVPPRPSGRLWLLRPPEGHDDLDGVVDALAAGAGAAGVPSRLCSELVAWTSAVLREWFPAGP